MRVESSRGGTGRGTREQGRRLDTVNIGERRTYTDARYADRYMCSYARRRLGLHTSTLITHAIYDIGDRLSFWVLLDSSLHTYISRPEL